MTIPGRLTIEVPTPTTVKEWYSWLGREESKSKAGYQGKPSTLIADYNRERAITRDYEGREILELLQNANDQAAEAGIRGNVIIQLSPEGLIVANTGKPFSTGGVESLQTSHLSPKRLKRRELIGNKGLGFRSILNWTKTPIILSGALRLAYSVEHARERLQSLMHASAELASRVQIEQRDTKDLILPLLSFPYYSLDGNLNTPLLTSGAKTILARCQTLIDNDGYETAIGLPFDRPESYDAAQVQVANLRPEILLFTKHLDSIVFDINAGAQTWKVDGSDGVLRVLSNDVPIGEWRVFRKSEPLPEAVMDPDHNEAIDYEIVVAVPTKCGSDPTTLFSYFPTEVTLPLAVVCHATLELEQNRKHIQQGRKSNEFVLGQLASFLADIAEKIATNAPEDPWAGCSLLMPLGDFSSELENVRFSSLLLEAARSKSIVPTLGGLPCLPDAARLVPGANASWLPKCVFAEVVPIRRLQDFKFLEKLKVPRLEKGALKQRLIKHAELSMEARVRLIDGLLQNQIATEEHTSALFLDTRAASLEDGMRVFLSPSSGQVQALPEWGDLRFLNKELASRLEVRLNTRGNRELQAKLATFGLLEYSLGSVISALVAGANRAIKAEPELSEVFEEDLMRTIFMLYLAEDKAATRPDYPEKRPLHLRSQLGQSVAANTLYLGSGFGKKGAIIQSLFEPWAPERLLDFSELPSLTGDLNLLREFLLWIGVAEWPRNVIDEKPNAAYLAYVLGKLTFPARFEDYIFDSQSAIARPSVKMIKTIEGLDQILLNADPNAITAWLALDERAPNWQRWSRRHADLSSRPGQTWSDRVFAGELPCYIRWILETTPWLPLPSGGRVCPKDCVLGERAIETLFPRPGMPAHADLKQYGISQSDVLEGWRRAGVLTSLAYLERDEIYAKLLELPDRSPDGKLARPLYQWLLDANEIAIGEAGVHRDAFLSRGKMWGRCGDQESYYPVAELHHADGEGLPAVLLQRLKIVDLRKRIGADKVERLFGVKPVDRAGIGQSVKRYQVSIGSGTKNEDFQAAKPFLHKLRTSQTSQLINLQTLKEIQLRICSELTEDISYKTEQFEYDVPVWDWLIDDKVLYVRADPADPLNLSKDLLADAIGEALASIFRLGDGGEFARMLLCNDKDRPQLLRKMRGDSVVEDFDAIKSEFDSFQIKGTVEALFPIVALPTIVAPVLETRHGQFAPQDPKVALSSTLITHQSTSPAAVLQVEEETPVVSTSPNIQKIRIQTITTPSQTTAVIRRITDGTFCEHKALEFEESDVPPRFPLLVSHTVGSQGSQCDIISFGTSEARENFRAGPSRDVNTVLRFIEVKGRNNAAAIIELKGNELSAAETYGERYYLYRLFEADIGNFTLTVLQNPLKHKEALLPAVHIDLNRAVNRKQFNLSGGIQQV